MRTSFQPHHLEFGRVRYPFFLIVAWLRHDEGSDLRRPLQSLVIAAWWLGKSKSFPQAQIKGTPCNFQLALALITCLSKVSWRANLSGHSGHLNVLFASCTSLIWRFNEPLVEKSLSQMEHLCFTSKWTLSIWSSIVDFLANVLWHSGHWGLGIVKQGKIIIVHQIWNRSFSTFTLSHMIDLHFQVVGHYHIDIFLT